MVGPRALRAVLEPGERIVWSQRARPYTLVSEAGLALIGRLVPPLIVVLIAWELLTSAERRALVEAVRAIPDELFYGSPVTLLLALAVALLLARVAAAMLGIFGTLLTGLPRIAGTIYAVTDRRVLIVEPNRTTSLKRLPMLRIERHPLGHDLVFAERRHGLGERVGFFGLVDSTEIAPLLLPFVATRDTPV